MGCPHRGSARPRFNIFTITCTHAPSKIKHLLPQRYYSGAPGGLAGPAEGSWEGVSGGVCVCAGVVEVRCDRESGMAVLVLVSGVCLRYLRT